MAERLRRGCAAATGREAQARNRYLSAFAFGGEQVEQHLPIRISQEFAGENRIARAAALEVPSCDRARERGAIEREKAECGSTVDCRLRLPDRIRQPRQLEADPLDLIGVDGAARAHADIPNPGSPRSGGRAAWGATRRFRSEEHTSELQSLMRHSYAVFC